MDFVISLIITMLLYLPVPLLYCNNRKNELTVAEYRKFVIIYTITVKLFAVTYQEIVYGHIGSYAPAVVWGALALFLGQRILAKHSQADKIPSLEKTPDVKNMVPEVSEIVTPTAPVVEKISPVGVMGTVVAPAMTKAASPVVCPVEDMLLTEESGPVPQVRFCYNCGYELKPGSKFCSSCGTKIG